MSPPFDLYNTLGALFIGLIVASGLHGVSIVQAWYYYTHQSDTWALKTLVGMVTTFDTIHQVLVTHAVYTYVVIRWGDPGAMQELVWSMKAGILFNALTAFLVQSFMAMRVWQFSHRNIWLTGLIALLVFAGFACLLATTFMSIDKQVYVQLLPLKPLTVIVTALATAANVLVAGALCTMLHLSRTGFYRSDTMINKLMLFTVNTGLITSLCAIGALISIVVADDTFIYMAFFICLGRVYTSTLLATLNTRKQIRKAGESNGTGDRINVSLREFPKNGGVVSRQAGNISIKIDTTKEFVTDHDKDMEKTDASNSNVKVFEEKKGVISFSNA